MPEAKTSSRRSKDQASKKKKQDEKKTKKSEKEKNTKKSMVKGADRELKHERPLRKAAITGVAVICEMLTGGLFMENVKMEKQRTSDPYPKIINRTLRQGVKGFEAGFWPWGATLGMTKGVVLGGARAFFLNLFMTAGYERQTCDIASGFCAGGVQGIFMSPILLGRTRVNQHLSERAISEGVVQTSLFGEMRISMSILNESIARNGVSTLMIGMPTMVFKRSMDWGTRFVFMRQIRQLCHNMNDDPNEKLSALQEFFSAFTGGCLSVFVTQPIDRLMPILQSAGHTKNESIVGILRKKLAAEGLTTLQRGGVMRIMHTGWHTTFAIFLSKQIYDILDERL